MSIAGGKKYHFPGKLHAKWMIPILNSFKNVPSHLIVFNKIKTQERIFII